MTSARSASLKKISRPASLFRFNVIARLLRCRFWKSGPSRRLPVASTSSPEGSILITWAPQSASWRTAVGPARCAVRSITRKSFKGSGGIPIGRFSVVERIRATSSAAGTFAEGRVGGLPLRRRKTGIKRLEHRQKPLQSGELNLVILDLCAQLVDGRGIGRRLMRSAHLGMGICPQHISDGAELYFLGGRYLQPLMEAGDICLDIRRWRVGSRLSQHDV